MNKYGILSYVLIFIIGIFTGYLEIYYSDWEFWILLILIVSYGAMNRIDVLVEASE